MSHPIILAVMALRDRASVAGVHAAQQDRGGQVPGVRHRPGRRLRRRGADPRPVPPRPLGVPRLHLREQSKAGRVSGGRSSPVSSSASKSSIRRFEITEKAPTRA